MTSRIPAFQISAELNTRFPDVSVYAFKADLGPTDRDRLTATVQNARCEAEAQAKKLNLEKLAEHTVIDAWRQAYREMGLKPAKYRSSVEQLTRRVARSALGLIGIDAVDLYNAISVKHLAPVGAYDLTQLEVNPIVLRFAQPQTDSFDPLGGSREDYELDTQTVVYAQDSKVLCWAINHRDAASTAVTARSDQIVFVSEGVDALTAQNAAAAIAELKQCLDDAEAATSEIQVARPQGLDKAS